MKQNKLYEVNAPQSNDCVYINTYTEEFLDFLYPEGPTNKRLPLTRCLFYGLVELISVFKEPQKQNFKTVIEILDRMLLVTHNQSITQDQRIEIFLKEFHQIPKSSKVEMDLELEEYAIDAFCYYDKVDVQKFTIACLMFDLLPLINMSFEEMHIAIQNGQNFEDVKNFQTKKAMYENNQAFMRIMSARLVANILFNKNDITQKSMFIVAYQIAEYFEATYNGLTNALHFHVNEVKNELQTIIKSGFIHCEEMFAIDHPIVNFVKYYKHICESAEVVNIAVHVLERILLLDCDVSDIAETVLQKDAQKLKRYMHEIQVLKEQNKMLKTIHKLNVE